MSNGRLIVCKGIDDFFCFALWLMGMAVRYGLPFAVVPMQDFIPPMDIHIVIELALFGFGGRSD